MTCKYCRKSVPCEPIIDSCGEREIYESVLIEHIHGRYDLNLYTEQENISVTINYCPMCGSKLMEGK